MARPSRQDQLQCAVTELDPGESKENVSEVRSGTKPIFAIFEGGGAKGIVHVGAYAAADELEFEFIGVAGLRRARLSRR